MVKVAPDTFISVSLQSHVSEIRKAVEDVKSEGLAPPRYLVVVEPNGGLAGILPSSELDWIRDDSANLASHRLLTVKRPKVAIDAPTSARSEAVRAGQGLALAVDAQERPIAVLRPFQLGLDGELSLGREHKLAALGYARCSKCGGDINGLNTVLLRAADGRLVYRRLCPLCRQIVSERA